MARPGGELTLGDVREAVSIYLGWADLAARSAQEIATVNRCVNSGIRRYLYPADPTTQQTHRWRFLAAGALAVSIVEGIKSYVLPDDFGGFESDLNYDRGVAVQTIPYADLVSLYAGNPNTAGDPLRAALTPVYTPAVGQRWSLEVYPLPSRALTLAASYSPVISLPTLDTDYLPGGGQHGEGIMESCLAVAEEQANDESGLHKQHYQEILLANIEIDGGYLADTLGQLPFQNQPEWRPARRAIINHV